MNRQILFKAKRKDNGEWVEGFVFEFKNKFYITEMAQTFMTAYYTEKSVVDFNMRAYEIDPETLCQYTGLTDKNGRKIWENDICEMVYDGVVNTYVIVWDKDELDFKGTNGKEDYGLNFEYLGCCEEIITLGNIFDNADLLEVE